MDDMNDLTWNPNSNTLRNSQTSQPTPIPSLIASFPSQNPQIPKMSSTKTPPKNSSSDAFDGLVNFGKKSNTLQGKPMMASQSLSNNFGMKNVQNSQSSTLPSQQIPTSSIDAHMLDAFLSTRSSTVSSANQTNQFASKSKELDLDFFESSQPLSTRNSTVVDPLKAIQSAFLSPVQPIQSIQKNQKNQKTQEIQEAQIDIFDPEYLASRTSTTKSSPNEKQSIHPTNVNLNALESKDSIESGNSISTSTDSVSVSISDGDIARLMAAGFDPIESRIALEASGGNVEKAVDILFENRNSIRQEKSKNQVTSIQQDPRPTSTSASMSTEASNDFWNRKQSTQEMVFTKASEFGMSFLKSAKDALDYSKKKLNQVVEKAQEKTHSTSSSPSKKMENKWTNDSTSPSASNWKPYKDEEYGSKPVSSSRSEKVTETISKNSPKMSKSNQVKESKESKDDSNTPIQISQMENKLETLDIFNSIPVSTPVSISISNPISVKETVKPTIKPYTSRQIQASQMQIDQANLHKEKGNNFFKGGQYGDAEVEYSLAIQCLPEGHSLLVALYNNRAGARLKNGMYEETITDCNYVQSYELGEIKSLLRRANAYECLEKWEEAREDYRKIIGIDSNVKGVSLGLSRCNKALSKSTNSNETSILQPVSSIKVLPPASASK